MTLHDRLARSERAKAAMDEFFAPAFAHVEQDYAEKMIQAAASVDPRAPEIITRLANGVKVARQVRAQIEAIVAGGKLAEQDMAREAQIGRMSEHKRNLVGV